MKSLILFLKGIIIGIGKIIPGVSGSLLAISLGIYEKTIAKLNNPLKNMKENIFFFLPLGLGIIMAVLFGSNLILYCLEHYYIYTMTIFIGLIIGTIPSLVKEQKINGKDWLPIFLVFFLLYISFTYVEFPEFIPSNHLGTYLFIIILGMIEAFTMLIPGISGTATYMMLGSYTFILNLFANPFKHIFYVVLFIIGFIIGAILVLKLINKCFKKWPKQTWIAILSFLCSSVFFLLLKMIDHIHSDNIFSLVVLGICSYFLINIFIDK